MKPILAISTVAETIIALQTADGVVDFRVNTARRGQAEYLVPSIQTLLADYGLTLRSLDRIGVVTGPGSFTGLRVGLAAAEGFAVAMGTPLVGIETFMLWRWAARQAGLTKPIGIVLDTLRDDVFIGAYDNHRTLLDPQVMSIAAAKELVEQNDLVLVGDGGMHLPEYNFVPISHASLAEALLQLTATLQNTNTAPVYLRAPDITQPKTAA